MTTTTAASAFDYLTAVANGQTKAAGLKRPTAAALQQAAKALGLSDRVDHAPYGYHVGKGWDVSPCPNLKAAAAALLAAFNRASAAAPAPTPAAAQALPKAAQAILELPGVESLEREGGDWCCHLRFGWTTEALGGGGTIIDASLKTIRAFVRGAYALPPAPAPAAAPTPDPLTVAITELVECLLPTPIPAPAAGPLLPGEPATPAPFIYNWAQGAYPANPAPELPAFVTHQQQQQQPQQAPAAPAPVVAPGPRARTTAPLGMPEAAADLLERFNLNLEGLLTAGASSPKLSKGGKIAQSVILHHLPARSLAAAVYGTEATTAPRSRLDGLAALAEANGIGSLISRHNGCPWASKGCSAGCLAWAGHGGISTTVAAARARRTMAYVRGHGPYALAVLWAIGRAYAAAQRKGQPLAYRLRGTDDLPWHTIRFDLSPAEAARFARRFGLPVVPGVGTTIPEALQLAPKGTLQPYEYSAAPLHGLHGLAAQRAAGIDTTCSLKADRQDGLLDALAAVGAGFRLAVPVALPKGAALPPVLMLKMHPGAAVWRLLTVDGDVTDHRWMDPQGPQPGGFDGVAVLLRTKISRGRGPAAADFSLSPQVGLWQPLTGGGHAALSHTTWID